jgi:hypothetical protein
VARRAPHLETAAFTWAAGKEERRVSHIEFRMIRIPRWAIVLAVSLAIALGLTLAVIAAGLFLIVFPVMLVLTAAAAMLGLLRGRSAARRQIRVIDADYVVLHDEFGREDRPRR